MSYINWLDVSQMKWLNLFDDIPYKHIKDIINEDDDAIYVEIEDIPVEDDPCGYNKCKTKFIFELKINVSGGSLPLYRDEKFTVIKEYDSSSQYGMYMCDLWEEEEEEETN